ncbi:interphotoreceptor matrix proteoglycan 1 isoform X2 [Danio rerio]|uniref:Interphotoreceptor matrix proteoglycan 1 n=1 Tax=Danio rerio TaxID=7955 RepID=A0A8N7T6R1_DANRE|nr:interphotoreceptor matrix proteoglycan 1 isoform X2 [Danio rerio]|eukprot:XP_687155.6 interphotoreceptor matrix proteoglycan 1 isoform X2 [Danio rerio]
MPLKTGLFLILFLFTLQATGIKEPTADDLVFKIRNVKYRHFLETPQQNRQLTDGRDSLSLDRHRAKRSALFGTGVKVCPQESMAEVITSHKAYYKLRVCQEAVWEAFRIFLDRVPDTMEYQQWVYACQRDSLCIEDLARNFSSTQEHLDIVASRVNQLDEQDRALTPAPGEKCSKSPAELFIMESDSETGAPDVVPQRPVEHIVRFSVTVVDPVYSALLRDPASPQYEDLTRNLHDQMLHAFDKLPGFKEIQVLGFRAGGVEASYAVVFETDGTQAIGDTDSTDEYGIQGVLKGMVVKVLNEDTSLPVDVRSLTFEPDSSTADGQENLNSGTQISEKSRVLPGEMSTPSTKADSDDSIVPSGSLGIPFKDVDPDRTWDLGVGTERSFIQKVPDILSHATALPAGAELISSPSLEGSKAASLITEDTLATKGSQGSTTVDYLSKMPEDQEGAGNEIVSTAAPLDLRSFEAEKASTLAQSEMDFDSTPETTPAEATSSISTLITPTEQAKGAIFQVDDTIGPSESLETSNVGIPSYPTSPVDSPAIPTSIDPSDHLEPPSVSVTVDTLHLKVTPAGPTTPEPILPATILSQLTPTEDLISHPTPNNFLDEQEQVLRTASSPPHEGGADDEGETKQDVEQSDEEDETLDLGSGFPSEIDENPQSSARPLGYVTTPSIMASNQAKELVVFFSLRVTNMMFSEDLFNKSSPEYKSLENTFLELLLPYLQSNLTGFKELEILNFKNGSVVVNSKMTLNKPVPYNVTETVQCVLEDFCNAASKRLNMEIDSQSVDVEAADHADPCKFMACNEFSRCVVNTLTEEGECLCDPGYSTVDGDPCTSICDLEPEYCLNGGLCEIIPGHGATCRCPVGKFWHYHGERCSELVSVPVDPVLFVTCLVGSLSVVCAVIGILIFINKKCIRTRKSMRLVRPQSAFPFGNTMRVNPVFENDDGVLTHVSSILCPMSSDSASLQQSGQGTFRSIESLQLSIEIPRQLYTRRSEKLMSEMVDFHQYIPHNEMRRTSSRSSCCFLRSPDSEGFEVTVL